jgi:hypothetical protein
MTRSRDDEILIQQAVRRTVGISVLHRLRRMANAESEAAARNARWARRLVWGLAALALCGTMILVALSLRA